jgi:CubicO group peptidase (beta-lactamase class C family)
MKKTFVIFLGLIFFAGQLTAQSLNTAKLDSLFTKLSDNNKAMASVAISKNGHILYSKAIGYSSINDGDKIPSTEKTKYRIGSVTKMFTAVMMLQLAEEGKISLDETLDKYFPDIPNATTITIKHLLNHRSGIHSFTDDSTYLSYMTQPKTEKEMLSIIASSKPDFEPGSKYHYSNSNYVILGYIIEKVCHKPYKEVLEERITSKTGLTDTYYGGKTDIKARESHSYLFENNNWVQQPETDLSIPHGAGALVSTPTDLVKFIEALFSYKLINKSSVISMKTMVDGYGMGMVMFPFYERKAYGHDGAIDGFNSILAWFPEDSVAVAYCSNGLGYPMNDILIGILSICFNKPYSIPTFKTISLTTEELDKYLGVYASSELPIRITVTKDKTTLIAQGEGQEAFALEATEKDLFRYDAAGIVMEFHPDSNEFILEQGGGVFHFTKEK